LTKGINGLTLCVVLSIAIKHWALDATTSTTYQNSTLMLVSGLNQV